MREEQKLRSLHRLSLNVAVVQPLKIMSTGAVGKSVRKNYRNDGGSDVDLLALRLFWVVVKFAGSTTFEN